jgi:hypothetical protein
MIGCRTVQDRLPEYAAGRTVPDAEHVAAHLARCERCAASHRDLTALFARLAAVPEPEVPVHGEPNARLALHAAMAGEMTPRGLRPRVAGAARSRMSRPRPVLAAVGMAGLVTGVGLAFVWWIGRPVSERRVNRNAMVAVNPSPQPPPRSGEGESGPSLSRARAGHHPGYRHIRLQNGAFSPLRFGEGLGEGSTVPAERDASSARRSANSPVPGDDTGTVVRPCAALSPSDQDALEREVRYHVPVRDDFVRVPFPRLASASDRQIAEAVESYKREAVIVDPRLAHEVTLEQKATALSDLCERLRADTGIQLTAGQSVADEKVTLFCEKMPLREVMRQLSRPFGYTWLRSGKAGEYRYELVQDLRSQLLEEELRNRDRNAALLALEKEIQRYRPYLQLSPDEALARVKTAPPNEQKLLENLAGHWGWGPIHMYFRLSPQELATLRSGGALAFSTDPYPGQYRLPSDLARGVLQSWREWHMVKTDRGFATKSVDDPSALPVSAFPELGAQIRLYVRQSELGEFTLSGSGGYLGPNKELDLVDNGPNGGVLAVGVSPLAHQPDNAPTNAKLAGDPALRPRVAIQARPSCNLSPLRGADLGGPASAPKATTGDVLEALHRASGLPIVADHYTRLYVLEAVSVRHRSLFEALNLLADRMRLLWHKESRWLEFRSSSYYYDRFKEVPNRLLRRWETVRRQHGALSLDDLVEIAQLPDAQLDGAEMAEGARECWGLTEWDLARKDWLRPHLRYLASFTPEQRQEALSPTGLAFTKMSLSQQQQFIANAIYVHGEPLRSLDELAGAVLRVDYTQPGWFEWRTAGEGPFRWVLPVEPGPQGRRVLRAPIRERTREAAWQAAGRAQPQVREALLQVSRHYRLPAHEASNLLQKSEIDIAPTKLYLGIIYIPGTSNRRPLHLFDNDDHAGVYLSSG